MPCRDWGDPDGSSHYLERAREAEAMLCLVVRTHLLQTGGPLGAGMSAKHLAVLEQQCGVSFAALSAWWKEHERADAERMREEERQRKKREKREAVLKKLTPEERRILGL